MTKTINENSLKLFKELTKYKYSSLKRDNTDFTKSYILYLLKHKKTTSPSDIINEINIKPQALANILKNMEDDKLIKRKINSSNKRKIDIFLTDKGINIGLEYCKTEIKKIEKLIDFLGEEDAKHLIRILERVSEYAEKI